MSDQLDIRTRNILAALESTLTHSKATLEPETHEAMVESLAKGANAVKTAYGRYRGEEITAKQYSKVLLRLAELTLMAVRRLPG